MKFNVLKGLNEIGGNCIEVFTQKTRLLFDYGTPLSLDSKPPNLSNTKYDALILSHSHQDHYGMVESLLQEIPVYSTKLMVDLINAAKLFSKNKLLKRNFHFFKPFIAFKIGDITITPFLNDHSSSESFSFRIDGEGSSIFYTGDLRSHGRKGKLFSHILKNPPKKIDTLIIEGTNVNSEKEHFVTEKKLEDELYTNFKSSTSVNFVICSSQNLDRVITTYKACKRSRKTFVIDIYTAWILEIHKSVSNNIPQISWEDVKVLSREYVGSKYYPIVKENPDTFGTWTKQLYEPENCILIKDIAKNPSKYVLKISDSLIESVIKKLNLKPNVIYSMWEGYMNKTFNERSFKRFKTIRDLAARFEVIHTSGHISKSDITRLMQAIDPKELVPIHTQGHEEMMKIFRRKI